MSKLEQVTEQLWQKHIAPQTRLNVDGYVVLDRKQFGDVMREAANAGVTDAELE